MCRKGITKLSTVLTALSSVLYEIMICNCVEIHLQITFQTKKRLKTEKNGQITVPENVLFPGLRQELPRVSKIVMTTFSKFQTFFKVFASGFFCHRFFWKCLWDSNFRQCLRILRLPTCAYQTTHVKNEILRAYLLSGKCLLRKKKGRKGVYSVFMGKIRDSL